MNKVLVIIPVYRAKDEWLNEAVLSVLIQSHRNLRLVVVSDACPDYSERLISSISDKRIIVHRLSMNLGASSARNYCVNEYGSDCDYVSFLDQDDAWDKRKLERQVLTLSQGVGGFCYCNVKVFRNNSYLRFYSLKENLYRWLMEYLPGQQTHKLFMRNYIRLGTGLIATREFLKIGGYDLSLAGGEDWDLWYRLSKNSRGLFIWGKYLFRRVHENNTSIVRSESRAHSFLGALYKYRNDSNVSGALFNGKLVQISAKLALIGLKMNSQETLELARPNIRISSVRDIVTLIRVIKLKLKGY